MTNISIEDRKVFAALAVAIADCLECSTCPPALAEILAEAENPLADLLAGSGSGYSITGAPSAGWRRT